MRLYGRVNPKCSRKIERAELEAQQDPVERGKRLRAMRDRQEAITLDGTSAEPLGEGFTVARLVQVPE